ncbi:glycosyltransferase family 4 protein [Methanolobus halotolerans]|uniref:Glycosyltransferase family 1 protein n=1 Tax=Methanolobus halotolerans TaxID=2052935 RepID=A0A4E0QBQ9_9EURY|nr:glycosyltransferase family 1 protein [Methanolobus halotolerans]TGC10614.1 glycosyltransferase family 1 protein [Methanolobus halotolerans]
MKIGFDSRTLMVKGGSRTYAYNLIQEIMKEHKEIEIALFGGDKVQNYTPINPFPQNEFLRVIWENLSIIPYMKKEGIDVFHGLKNVAPYYNYSNTKTVITVHDITPLIFPSMLPLKAQMYWNIIKFNIKKADKIISVSNTTKNDLIKTLNIDKDKISVIYHGISEEFKIIPTVEKNRSVYLAKYGLNLPESSIVVLAVSTIHPRKNYLNLITAFNAVKEKSSIPVHLVIVGKVDNESYSKEVNHLIATNNLSNNVHLLGYVPDEELPALYNLADLFVYPSIYEGFGLPILEAQACGCPVITSNLSSMPEVAGNGAILVDPTNMEEITSAIYTLVLDSRLRKELIEKGMENCKKFSWEKCAEETLNVYAGVNNGK